MRIFLTGATGFVGSHFLNLIACEAPEIEVAALRRPGSWPRIPLVREPVWISGTLAECDEECLKGCDAVVHLAAAGVLPQFADWDVCFKTNVFDSLAFWRRAVERGVKRFLICGSCFEYGRTAERVDFVSVRHALELTGAYEASKAAATMAALGLASDFQLALAVLRPFHIFGEGEAPTRFWPSLREAARSGRDFAMTDGMQVRDFTPVELVARKFLERLKRSDLVPGKPVVENIGTGKPQRLRDFAEHWWGVWGGRGRLLFGEIAQRRNEVMRYVPEL